jgi:drug/metabolite transporter superfamily protein YnfA
MLIVRIVALAALLAIGGSLLAWMLTGDPKYRQLAWNLFIGALLVILAVLLTFVFERFANPSG